MPLCGTNDHETLARLRDSSLERLPDTLYAAVATGPVRSLNARIEGVIELRSALLAGTSPPTQVIRWPESPIKEKLLSWLIESGLPRYCRDSPDLADAVILSMIDGIATSGAHVVRSAARLFQELKTAEENRRKLKSKGGVKDSNKIAPALPQAVSDELLKQAIKKARAAAGDECARGMESAWSERLRAWAEIEDVFGELGAMCGLGWDLSRGILHHTGWHDVQRLAELLKRAEQIREITRTLGRMQSANTEETESILERLLGPTRRAPEERRQIETPDTPHETRGVERSDEVSRMLPSEAALFIHPTLRLLWHAKRAERTLSTYRVVGTDSDRFVADENASEAREAERRQKKLERGPIIVCLDTSGSMQGAPETVAKAITLEAMRIANAERRACCLYAFSGPMQVQEMKLAVGEGGITALLEFLGCSFHGGTDVQEPLTRAFARLKESQWSRADIILVSDGEFPISRSLRDDIKTAKAEGALRVHGLLIGAEQSDGMAAICEPIHVFKDWNTLREG